jgi:hypothetical protein
MSLVYGGVTGRVTGGYADDLYMALSGGSGAFAAVRQFSFLFYLL